MSDVLALLKERYLAGLKEEPELFVGIELELPIVNLTGQATDTTVSKALLVHLADILPLVVEQYDENHNPIQLRHPETGDCILFEVSYNLLEFAFGKAVTIQEVEQQFTRYLILIQSFLATHQHALEGLGVHPTWEINDNRPVAIPRYRMLTDFLALANSYPEQEFHSFTDYGGFICGSQVQLDVSRSNYLRVLNAFNQLEPVKAYLFANSPFTGADWQTKISRDIFWEQSMHGYYPENVGLYPQSFASEEEFLDYLSQSSLFYVLRDDEVYYFPPIRVKDYLTQTDIKAFNQAGKEVLIQLQPSDLTSHRTYHYQSLTTRGTVEFRSACCQPLEHSFAVAAFHLGLLANLNALEQLLSTTTFYQVEKGTIPELRRKYASLHLYPSDLDHIQSFAQEVLDCARQGLLRRGYGEEGYLAEMMK